MDLKEITVLREEALRYFGPDGLGMQVLECMEDAANSLFYDNPEDINAYLASYFQNLALRPTLTQIHARFAISCEGLPAFEIDIFCKFKNTIKLVSTLSTANTYNSMADNEKALVNVEQSMRFINETLSNKFFNCCPYDQLEFDDELREMFAKFEAEYLEIKKIQKHKQQEEKDNEVTSDTESIISKRQTVTKPQKNDSKGNAGKKNVATQNTVAVKSKEKFTSILENIMPGMSCKSAISQSLCYASSVLQDVPLYKYISNFYNVGVTSPFTIPLPLISLFQSDQIKCVKEIFIIPAPNFPLHKLTVALTKIHSMCQNDAPSPSDAVQDTKSTKESRSGKPMIGGNDKLEDIVDNIKEIISKSGYILNEDFYIGLNCSAHNYYQEDNNVYEVSAGIFKSPSDLRKFWLKIKNHCPSIICFIDPFHKQNKEEWTKLCGEISSDSFIFGQNVFSPASKLIHEVHDPTFSSSGVMLQFDDSSTVSDVWKSAFKLKDNHQLICMSSNEEDTFSSFCVDMAVALRAMFIKVGVITRPEKTIKLNRLIQIYDELHRLNSVNELFGSFIFQQVGSMYKETEDINIGSDHEKERKTGPQKKSPKRRSVVKN